MEAEAFIREIAGLSCEEQEALLWKRLTSLQGQEFRTAKGLVYTYTVRGRELFVDRKVKSKSITQSTVMMAFHKALEMEGKVSGPQKLGTFGASYLYPVFIDIGLIVP